MWGKGKDKWVSQMVEQFCFFLRNSKKDCQVPATELKYLCSLQDQNKSIAQLNVQWLLSLSNSAHPSLSTAALWLVLNEEFYPGSSSFTAYYKYDVHGQDCFTMNVGPWSMFFYSSLPCPWGISFPSLFLWHICWQQEKDDYLLLLVLKSSYGL